MSLTEQAKMRPSIKMMHAILAVAIALAAVPVAAAESRNVIPLWYGRDLQRLCDADGKSAEHAMCWSYVSAILEIVSNDSLYAFKVCIPPLVNVQKAIDLTTKWLRDHPDSDIRAASLVTTEALADAFPCKN